MRRKNRLAHLCIQSGIPADVLGSGARATLMGRTCVLLEGHRGVVELSQGRIRLRTGDGVMSVLGSGLELKELSVDTALVSGREIETMTYGKTDRG